MEMKTQAKVTGAKFFNDVVEGTRYDTTKIFVETSMNDSAGTACGSATVEYQWGDSKNYRKIEPFIKQNGAFVAELTLDVVTNGKQQKVVVLDLKPLQTAKA